MSDNAFIYLTTPRQVRSTIVYKYEDTYNHKCEVFKAVFSRDFKPVKKSAWQRLIQILKEFA